MRPLEHVPCLKNETVEKLTLEYYGIRATASLLPSERDQNFLLTDGSGEKYVLKIANALEELALLEAQNAALGHLGDRISFCPRIVPTSSGEQLRTVDSSGGSTHFVRLVSYLHGVPLAESKPHSAVLLCDLGQKLGQLAQVLSDFDHPALHRDFHWDLSNGLRVIRDFGRLIRDATLHELVIRCRHDFEHELSPLLLKLRRSVIHGDANDFNVLVESGRVVGLVDFGDMVHSYTVGDLAIAIAYVVLDKNDPLGAAAHVVAGYTHAYALSDDELKAVWGLVLMRLCMSVCLAAYQQQQRPENEYLAISQRSISESLPRLVAIDARIAADKFRNVLATDQCR